MGEGTHGILPRGGGDLGQVPLRFRQRPLILTDLAHVQSLLEQRASLWLIAPLLDVQDRQAIESQAGERELTLALRIGEQLFLRLLGLLPGVLVGIGPPQVDIEAFGLRGRKLSLYPLWHL